MSNLNVEEIKPGWLVTEEIRLHGGIHYEREQEGSYFDDDAQIREWKTTSRIENVSEREEAHKLRSRFYSLVRTACVKTPVGLICEEDHKIALKTAIRTIKSERDTFNDKARTCRLYTNHALFEVKADNHDTIAAIMEQIALVAENVNSAITQDDEKTLKQSPRKWLKGMNPAAILLLTSSKRDAIVARARAELIRKAIKDIRGVETLLPKEASVKTKEIIKESRQIARSLCNKVERHNEALDDVLDEVDLSGIRKNRAAFVIAATKADKRALETEDEISPLAPRKIVARI